MTAGITYYEREDFAGGFGFGAGNPNCLYRHSIWQLHRFNEGMPAAEDLEWYVWAIDHGYMLAAVHAAAVLYASRRPLSQLFQKGRLDYRIASSFIDLPKPRLSVLMTHSAKLLLYGLLGKMPFAGMLRSFVQYLGTYVEGSKHSRTSSPR
jgi:cytochrome b561